MQNARPSRLVLRLIISLASASDTEHLSKSFSMLSVVHLEVESVHFEYPKLLLRC